MENDRATVDIISPFFPNYRTALFRQLDQSKDYNYTFLGSQYRYADNGVPGIDAEQLSNFVPLRSRALPGGLIWQSDVLKHVLRTRSRALVITGDVRHISTWLAALFGRARGMRVLFWTHGWTRVERGPWSMIRNAFYRLASDLLLYGEYAKKLGVAKGFDQDRMHVISNSMGAPIVRRINEREGTHTRRFSQRWIVISRLIPGRGIESVIHGASVLSQSGRQVRLTIVGDGPLRQELEAAARGLSIPVNFLGAIHDLDRTGELLKRSDLCLSPGHVGLAAIHALSSGCPVATHADPSRQMPEAEAVVDGVTGIRFPHGDNGRMIERSWEFVANSDAGSVTRACHAEVLRRWTPGAQAKAIERALGQSVNRREQPRGVRRRKIRGTLRGRSR